MYGHYVVTNLRTPFLYAYVYLFFQVAICRDYKSKMTDFQKKKEEKKKKKKKKEENPLYICLELTQQYVPNSEKEKYNNVNGGTDFGISYVKKRRKNGKNRRGMERKEGRMERTEVEWKEQRWNGIRTDTDPNKLK